MKYSTDAKTATKLLPNLSSFVAAVEAGSYTAAARRLGVDKTLISRRVFALEKALGVRLLQRSTRQMAPTEIGQRLFSQVASPISDVLTALLQAGIAQPLAGIVKVATISAFSEEIWVPVIEKLLVTHPELRIEVSTSDNFVDLIDGGFDFALRTGNMPDSSLSARRLGRWSYTLCAAPSWLENNPKTLKTPADADGHWLLFSGVPRAHLWHFIRGNKSLEVEMTPLVAADSPELVASLVLAGVGVTALPAYIARRTIESGELVRVLPEWKVDHPHSLWVVLPTKDYVPPRVRTVIDALTNHVRDLEKQWQSVTS